MARQRDRLRQRRVQIYVGNAAVSGVDRAAIGLVGGGCRAPVGKALGNLHLDQRRVVIAHHHNHRVGRDIFALPERAQLCGISRLQRLRGSDREPLGDQRIGISEFERIDCVLKGVIVAHPALGENHALLALDRFLVDCQLACGLAH